MKTTKAILSAFALMTALAVAAPAQNAPTPTPTPGNGSPQQGRHGNMNKGKKTGPQDGSGPIHQPGAGGGSGAGNRRGRK